MECRLFFFSLLVLYAGAQIVMEERIAIPCDTKERCRQVIEQTENFKCNENICWCFNATIHNYEFCQRKKEVMLGARARDFGVNRYCDHNDDCLRFKGMHCLASPSGDRKHCDCKDNFVMNTNGTACLEIVVMKGGQCNETVQCKAGLDNAECIDGSCYCSLGSHYADVRKRCVPNKGYGESCTRDELSCYQANEDGKNVLGCSSKNLCKCIKNYTHVRGLCQRSGASRLIAHISVFLVLMTVALQMS